MKFPPIIFLLEKLRKSSFWLSLFTSCVVAITIGISAYALFRIGISLHYDEWVGRGLYPGLAMGYGLDLYEPRTGPHVTLYGFGTALFYSITAISSTPSQAIWFGFLVNLIGFSIPVAFILNRILSMHILNTKIRHLTITGFILLLFAIFMLEPTTEGILRIHADLPALFFLLLSVCFFDFYMRRGTLIFLFLTTVCLSFSIWAKIPTLPSILYPVVFFFLQRKIKKALLYVPILGISLFLTYSIFASFYGWSDTFFILFEHIASGSWSVRNSLFDGDNAKLVKMSYIQAIPLLFRFLVMYLAEYWYISLGVLCVLVCSIQKVNIQYTKLLKNISVIYLLLIPTGLAALAHFGSVENSLLFVNAVGLLIVFFGLSKFLAKKLNPKFLLLFVWSVSLIFNLPFLRLSLGGPKNTINSPHHEAFEYLKNGKDDVYFGWYPLAHLLHSGNNYSCIETPIWAGMTRPNEIDFSIEHFPPNAKFVATGPTGYGATMLKQFIGELEEIEPPPELSSWRLFRPVKLQIK